MQKYYGECDVRQYDYLSREVRVRNHSGIRHYETMSRVNYNLLIGVTLICALGISPFIAVFAAKYLYNWHPVIFFLLGAVCFAMPSFNITAINLAKYAIVAICFSGIFGILLAGTEAGWLAIILATLIVVFSTLLIVGVMMMLGHIFPKFFNDIHIAIEIAAAVALVLELFVAAFGRYMPVVWDRLFAAILGILIACKWAKTQDSVPTMNGALSVSITLYILSIAIFPRL